MARKGKEREVEKEGTKKGKGRAVKDKGKAKTAPASGSASPPQSAVSTTISMNETPQSESHPSKKRKRATTPNPEDAQDKTNPKHLGPTVTRMTAEEKSVYRRENRSIFGKVEGEKKQKKVAVEGLLQKIIGVVHGIEELLIIANYDIVVTFDNTARRDSSLLILRGEDFISTLELKASFSIFGRVEDTGVFSVLSVPGSIFDGVEQVREGVLAQTDAPPPRVEVAKQLRWGKFGGAYIIKVYRKKSWFGKKLVINNITRLVTMEGKNCLRCGGPHSVLACTSGGGGFSLSEFE